MKRTPPACCPMKPPSELQIRRAVLRWTKAECRWAEFALADIEEKSRRIEESPVLIREMREAKVALLSLGHRMLSDTATSTAGPSKGEPVEKSAGVGRGD